MKKSVLLVELVNKEMFQCRIKIRFFISNNFLGAGKSSLFQTLFRLGEHTGRVSIDGIDIKSLSLHNLRKKISIIPVCCLIKNS